MYVATVLFIWNLICVILLRTFFIVLRMHYISNIEQCYTDMLMDKFAAIISDFSLRVGAKYNFSTNA